MIKSEKKTALCHFKLNSLDKLFALHHLYSALFVCLFVSLVCTICHVPYATLSIFILLFFIYIFLFYVFFFYMSLFVYL